MSAPLRRFAFPRASGTPEPFLPCRNEQLCPLKKHELVGSSGLSRDGIQRIARGGVHHVAAERAPIKPLLLWVIAMPISMTRRNLRLSIAITGLTVLIALPAAGQSSSVVSRPRHAAALVAGASQFDLSGTGTTGVFGARVETELRRWLVAEGALVFFRPMEQFGGRLRYTITEAQLQLQLPGRVFRPYLGVGGGYVFAQGNDMRGTGSVAAGVRVALRPSLDLRSELRVRGIGSSFSGSTAEWTIGLGYRF